MERAIDTHRLRDRVHITSGAWGADKVSLFEKCGILVLPSHFENFPLVVLEAAAAGMAIVSTPVGAVPEFFEDGKSAMFFEIGNAQQLASALQTLLQNPGKREQLGAAAREVFVKRLSRSRIMESLDSVYQHIISLQE